MQMLDKMLTVSLVLGTLMLSACRSKHDPQPVGPPSPTVDTGKATPPATSEVPSDFAATLYKAKKLKGGLLYFDDGNTKDSQSPFVGVIVPKDQGRRFYEGHYNNAQGYWTPPLKAVIALGHHLLANVGKHDGRIEKELHKYRFQLVGIIEKGKKLIFANGFCDAPEYWKQDAVIVDDGGFCYFTVKYDPQKSLIVDFSVNGDG